MFYFFLAGLIFFLSPVIAREVTPEELAIINNAISQSSKRTTDSRLSSSAKVIDPYYLNKYADVILDDFIQAASQSQYDKNLEYFVYLHRPFLYRDYACDGDYLHGATICSKDQFFELYRRGDTIYSARLNPESLWSKLNKKMVDAGIVKAVDVDTPFFKKYHFWLVTGGVFALIGAAVYFLVENKRSWDLQRDISQKYLAQYEQAIKKGEVVNKQVLLQSLSGELTKKGVWWGHAREAEDLFQRSIAEVDSTASLEERFEHEVQHDVCDFEPEDDGERERVALDFSARVDSLAKQVKDTFYFSKDGQLRADERLLSQGRSLVREYTADKLLEVVREMAESDPQGDQSVEEFKANLIQKVARVEQGGGDLCKKFWLDRHQKSMEELNDFLNRSMGKAFSQAWLKKMERFKKYKTFLKDEAAPRLFRAALESRVEQIVRDQREYQERVSDETARRDNLQEVWGNAIREAFDDIFRKQPAIRDLFNDKELSDSVEAVVVEVFREEVLRQLRDAARPPITASKDEIEINFAALDLPPDATFDQVKKAYRTLSLIYHPDKGGDKDSFHKIDQAYKALKKHFGQG